MARGSARPGKPRAGSEPHRGISSRHRLAILPAQHFIVDRHPGAANVWLVGGGSAQGFKHGPALGELAASNVLGEKPAEPFFSLSRFRANP